METFKKNSVLVYEEVKAVKFFLWTFYIILVPYDFVYYYLVPYFNKQEVGLPLGGLGFFFHIFLFALIPLAIYLVKKGQPEKIKYIYFIAFVMLDVVNNVMIYWGTKEQFGTGHVLEIYFILFSPIFVSSRFFWTMSIGFFVKYSITGLIFQSGAVLVPMGLIIFIAAIAWILLNRFQSYVKAITSIFEDLRQKEKLAVIGQMATAIAHEIKNPLSSLKGFTQLQQEKDKGDEQYYPIMLNEIDRINAIVNDLLILGKPNTGVKTPKKLIDIIQYVISVIDPHAHRREIQIKYQVDDSTVLLCDENQMKQVFINLIKNAMEAMPNGGTVSVQSKIDGSLASISVTDEGCGIPPEILAKLGEPFYTTKQNGNGLGLMVTKKIIEEHEGTFNIESQLEKGTCVTIQLPINA
ncbi:ATP-binding protein [Mesobacillus selenatarsenatis]|uniref:histidine kinase n=1 Tax=Mesobacillus selenatarsenatis TaxID=388741 RepID=A0A846TEF6_9BACI|nr:ATP-binding protein [Mesobacillus selenatarsenatis]NKE07468.1 two-component sensor histidine kinase [Mesobacillus selenatarsenatis]